MKYILILIGMTFLTTNSNAQNTEKRNGFFERQLLGNGEIEPLSLSLDVYPFLFFYEGLGGSIAVEWENWQVGAVGFSVKPPEFVSQTFFSNIDNISINRNSAFELFANYFLRKDRKGLYAGVIGGPEWFTVKDELTKIEETITESYLVPRLGVRVFPFKNTFYLDASFGYSFNLSGESNRTIGLTRYKVNSGGILSFIQIGARFKL